MSHCEEYLMGNTLKWPYPVNYGKVNEISTDILIIGGGRAGCHAAISTAKRGAKVVDKGAVIGSGDRKRFRGSRDRPLARCL